MKILYAFVVVLLFTSIIDAAPKPTSSARTSANKRKAPIQRSTVKGHSNRDGKAKRQFPIIFQGSSVYPNYYVQQSSPLIDFQNSFLQAAFLSGFHYTDLEKYLKKQNLTDSNGKALPLEAKIATAFDAAFGDQKGDAKGTTDLKAKIIALDGLDNIDLVNPFLSAKDLDGKLLKASSGLPGVKAANSSAVALISPFHGTRLDAVFGPEIAPRYEIHYSPQGVTLDPLPPFTGAGFSYAATGVAPIGPAPLAPTAFGPVLGPLPAFAIAPNFNALLSPYPYPYPFLPGFDPKSLKPNGKGNDGKKLDSTTEQPTETTSENFQEATSESAPADSSSEPTSESSASE